MRHTFFAAGAATLGACEASPEARLPTAEEQVLIDRGMARSTVEFDVAATMMERSTRTYFDKDGNTIGKDQAVSEFWDVHDLLLRYSDESRFRMFDDTCGGITTHVEKEGGSFETDVLNPEDVGGFVSQREGGIIAFASEDFDENFMPEAGHEGAHAHDPDFHHSKEMSDLAFNDESTYVDVLDASFAFQDRPYFYENSLQWIDNFVSYGEYKIDYDSELIRGKVSSGELLDEEAMGEFDAKISSDDPAEYERLVERQLMDLDHATADGRYLTREYFEALGNSKEDIGLTLRESDIRVHFGEYREKVRRELVDWLEVRKEGEQKMMHESERARGRK